MIVFDVIHFISKVYRKIVRNLDLFVNCNLITKCEQICNYIR